MMFSNAEFIFQVEYVAIYKVEPSIFNPFASTSYYWLYREFKAEFFGPYKSIADCIGNFENTMTVTNQLYSTLDLSNIVFIDFKKRKRIQ